jgi:hypothetical protein
MEDADLGHIAGSSRRVTVSPTVTFPISVDFARRTVSFASIGRLESFPYRGRSVYHVEDGLRGEKHCGPLVANAGNVVRCRLFARLSGRQEAHTSEKHGFRGLEEVSGP